MCSDYFDLKGKCYLVTIDRFSGWPDVRQAEKGKEFGAEGLMRICRDLFATFGVPREMSTDGASQFTSRVKEDKEITSVIQLAQEGFPVKYKDMPEELAQYWVHRDKLYVVDSVLLLGDRVVIPKLLREESLCNLHCAHQGCSRMKARASTCIFWPGIGSDIEKKRLSCATCDVIAPSQRRLPPQVPALPTSPFEAVA